MPDLVLTRTRIIAGVYEGVLTGTPNPPQLGVTHLGLPVAGIGATALPDAGEWLVTVPIPATLISDGVQTFVITDTASDTTLDSFSLIAGEALADDLRAEIDLLRAELDMLKRAFRRHCVETA